MFALPVLSAERAQHFPEAAPHCSGGTQEVVVGTVVLPYIKPPSRPPFLSHIAWDKPHKRLFQEEREGSSCMRLNQQFSAKGSDATYCGNGTVWFILKCHVTVKPVKPLILFQTTSLQFFHSDHWVTRILCNTTMDFLFSTPWAWACRHFQIFSMWLYVSKLESVFNHSLILPQHQQGRNTYTYVCSLHKPQLHSQVETHTNS